MNIIEIFQKGNLELFHSAFIAWLLNPNYEYQHGLGASFAKKLFEIITTELPDYYSVEIERKEGNNRFDIFLGFKDNKGIIIENKVKNYGAKMQIDKYKSTGNKVIYFAFLEHTIESQEGIKIIYYKDIIATLDRCFHPDESNHYHFFISQYIEYLKNQLEIYEAIVKYCLSNETLDELKTTCYNSLKNTKLNENDKRTFIQFIYFNFEKYLKRHPELIFGDKDYSDAKTSNPIENTKWIYKTKMQGPPFFETIIYNPLNDNLKFRFNPDILDIYRERLSRKIEIAIALRIEILDFNLKEIHAYLQDKEIGKILLGTWDQDLLNLFKSDKYNLQGRGPRNFYYEPLHIEDLRFDILFKRIKKVMEKLGKFI